MEDFTYMQGESLWTIAEEDYDHLEGFSLSMSMVDHEALPNFPEAARGLADPVFDFTLESPIAIQSDFSHTTSALYAESTESNQDHFSGWHSDELNNLTQVVDDVFDLQAACENDTGLMAASASNGADDDTLGTSHSPGDVDAYAESGAWPFDGLDINPGLITSEKPWQCFGSEDVDQIFTRPTSADFQSRRGFWLGYDNSLDLYASTVIARDTLSTLTAVDPCLPATPSQSVESQNYNGPKTLKRKASRHQVEDLTHHNEIPKSMCLIFRVSGPAFTKNKRVRTEETRHIKAIGACLRCHLLKRRCSGGIPCRQCSRDARRAMQSKSLVPLRFFDCVRDRLTSLNPFNREREPKSVRIALHDFQAVKCEVLRGFASPHSTNATRLATMLSKNLHVPAYEPEDHIVGALLTASVRNIIEEDLGYGLNSALHLFLVSVTVINATDNQTEASCLRDDSETVRDWALNNLLFRLERRLTLRELAKASGSATALDSLYLVILGTIAGVNWCYSRAGACHLDKAATYPTDSHHGLVQLLAHYLAYLGIRSHRQISPEVVQTLFQHAVCNFHLQTLLSPSHRVPSEVDIVPEREDEENLGRYSTRGSKQRHLTVHETCRASHYTKLDRHEYDSARQRTLDAKQKSPYTLHYSLPNGCKTPRYLLHDHCKEPEFQGKMTVFS